MKRANHYEAAFEAYLQWHRLGYVAVDETRRSILGGEPVKNLDFLVFGESGSRLLIDVKGRRFPSGTSSKARKVWECWTKEEDVDGLLRWQESFGADYHGVFVFAHHLNLNELPKVAGDFWTWRGQRYCLRGVLVDDYCEKMRQRSPKWNTVCLSGNDFRELARPFHWFVQEFSCRVVEDIPF